MNSPKSSCGSAETAARKQSIVLRRVGNLAPGDELDVLFAEELAEFGAGEEIEVALAPGGAPGFAFAGCGTHFGVIVGQVNDEFGYAWLQIAESVLVKVGPFFWRDIWFDGDGVVDDNVIGAESGREIRMIGEPVAGDEER